MLTRISCMAAFGGRCGVKRPGRVGVAEPLLETDFAEARSVPWKECAFTRGDAEVARVWVGDDLARIVALLQHTADELVESELVGSCDLHHAVQRRADGDPGQRGRA